MSVTTAVSLAGEQRSGTSNQIVNGTSNCSSPSKFTSIPILSLARARNPATKAAFLTDLRSCLMDVGFCYISDTGLPDELVEKVKQETFKFFDESVLPLEEKQRIDMINAKSFLGWSKANNETTAGHPDYREQLDLASPRPLPGPDAPLYHNLLAPVQWPSEKYLPGFKPVFEEYMQRMSVISRLFISLIAEALGMPATAFDHLFDENQQCRMKIVKYPEALTDNDDELARQGVGPHKDSMLTSYLLQASPQRGLQAQNQQGEWIDCAPIDGTLVVAMGQGLEALTGGVCRSTTHRVLSPKKGDGPRYSVPWFEGVSFDASFDELDVPEEVRELSRTRGERKDNVEFTFVRGGKYKSLGEATLWNRVKSHPDVGGRWYPELLKKIREEQTRAAAVQARNGVQEH